MDRKQAEDVGFWVGVGVFALVGLTIYAVYRLLLHRVGDGWATLALYVPAFAAVFVIAPVQRAFAAAALRRHCRAHGHEPEPLTDGVREIVTCRRCGALLDERTLSAPSARAG